MVNWILVGAATGLAIAVIGAILGWAVFPVVVRNQIDESITLIEDTEQFERWVNVPQPLDFKVYIFNVTNPLEVQNGVKPTVVQIGPYIYSQVRRKTVHSISENQVHITFTQQQTYQFNRRASAPFTEDDRIVVLNMAMNSIIQSAPATLISTLNGALNVMFDNPTSMFVSTTPRAYLFEGVPFCVNPIGLPQFVCNQLREQGSQSIMELPDGSLGFSFFNTKNVTHDGIFKIHSGVDDTSQIADILEWNDSPVLTKWPNPVVNETSVCNEIHGTDSSSFRPHLSASGQLSIFSSDICRSVNVFFDSRTTYKGITGFRFVTTDEFLGRIGEAYSNTCYCTGTIVNVPTSNDTCLLRGALDLSVCRGAPVVMTLPHMTGVDPAYTDTVIGQHPDPEKHQIFVEIEPNTGYPLRGGRRVQFNMFLKRIDGIDITENLATTLMPAVWVDEGIELNDEMVQMLNDQLLNILIILDVIHYLLIAIGLAIFIGMMIWYCVRRRNNSKVIKS